MPSSDRVTIRHPDCDGTFTVSRRSFPSRARRGWVEVTSTPSPVSTVDAPRPLEDAPDTASQED